MTSRRAIRIGNAPRAIGDGLDQVHRLAREGEVDAIIADYLAEFNLAWKAIERIDRPDLGYEPHFLTQLRWNDGEAARLVAQKNIKIVHDGGALNPQTLAEEVHAYLESQGIRSLQVAWVSGDNLTEHVRESKTMAYKHLDIEATSIGAEKDAILAANAYTGMSGIVTALQAGANIVICGRCCDASPVMGLASWWHSWNMDDYDKLAGSLMAGHIIECGAYATGGNYCGAREIRKQYRVDYPIAKIDEKGQAVITKPTNTNGAVTVDTVKAQFLYEIQDSRYLNPDAIARIDKAQLEEVGPDQIRMTGITGSPPPPTAKLAISRAEASKLSLLRELDSSQFTTLDITSYGTAATDPRTQAESTVMIRMFVQADTKEAIERFKHAIYYNGMQGYCELHLAMDWRTLEPRLFVKYFPTFIDQRVVKLSVHFVGRETDGGAISVPTLENFGCPFQGQDSYETKSPRDLASFGPTIRKPLGDLVFGRSGDKGGNANIGLWVRDAAAYPWLQAFLTVSRLIALIGHDWSSKYRVERFEAPKLWAIHFVVYGILQEGVSSSSVIDGFAKSFGEFIRARYVDIPQVLLTAEQKKRADRGWIEQGSNVGPKL
ncbi:DUF1446-domain-containing protein [Setomelanomma holmii]|uniref:DUF1446-domain-containing protein n=1 Tax=Setomelanomma holmii TaxID=210430 RepID=A0A9P4GZP9_9PLEO|nr:DUF1446-domain-containing protein [Setomelanomma holmii]